MAEGDANVYNHFKEQLLHGNIDLAGDDLKICLLGSGYTFSADGNNGYANVAAEEITTTSGYSTGGKTISGNTISQDDANDRAAFDASNLVWTSLATTTIENAVLYDDTVTAPVADPLLIHWEIATDSDGSNYTLNFHANGILLLE
jgi:hypothetical protein